MLRSADKIRIAGPVGFKRTVVAAALHGQPGNFIQFRRFDASPERGPENQAGPQFEAGSQGWRDLPGILAASIRFKADRFAAQTAGQRQRLAGCPFVAGPRRSIAGFQPDADVDRRLSR